ncbi:MAG: acyl carrier protein [Terriglobales bacterium]
MHTIPMNRDQFLLEMDEILDLPAGTLRGHENLEDLQNWDSTSLITFIAMAESNNGVSISPAQIVTCSTVADLLRLARAENSSS